MAILNPADYIGCVVKVEVTDDLFTFGEWTFWFQVLMVDTEGFEELGCTTRLHPTPPFHGTETRLSHGNDGRWMLILRSPHRTEFYEVDVSIVASR